MSRERLREQWESYRDNVLPVGAEEVQINETRLAFYAGAAALWSVVMNMLSPGAEPTDDDEQAMAEIEQELKSFAGEG